MAAQIRAIETGLEKINSALIKSVYRDDFRLINRILDAIKSADISPLHNLDDVLPPSIQPIHQSSTCNDEGDQNGGSAKHPQLERILTSAGSPETNSHPTSQPSVTQKHVSGRDSIGSPSLNAAKPSKNKKSGTTSYTEEDLRGIVLRGTKAQPSLDPYQALKAAGYIRAASEFL
jgi:hypothetical protein